MIIGTVTAQLVPEPGVIVGHVVFLEPAKRKRVLASVNSIHLWLSLEALRHGRLAATAIRFSRPRFIVHLDTSPSGDNQWTFLTLPESNAAAGSPGASELLIRSGAFELWDHTLSPTAKWAADQFNGSIQLNRMTGALSSKLPRFGREAQLDISYNQHAAFPLQARLRNTELNSLQPFLHSSFITLDGLCDISAKARFQPTIHVQAELDQPGGIGHLTASAQSDRWGQWLWSAEGKESSLAKSAFILTEWSVASEKNGLHALVQGQSAGGGSAHVEWSEQATSKDAALNVDVSSVTIQQILDVFQVQPSSIGYEGWRIQTGSMRALIHEGVTLDVQSSFFSVEQMPLYVTGSFDLAGSSPMAHIQGTLGNLSAPFIIQSFFAGRSPLTGTGQSDFDISFPLSSHWIQGFNGMLHIQLNHGVVRELKTIYRIISVLNLGNYLRLRFPQVTAQGIEFDQLEGHFTIAQGVFSTEDLFLKSPNMNIGVKGALNVPGKRLQATLRLEMFRFLEDILKDVPITHWIFHKPNKIFSTRFVATLRGACVMTWMFGSILGKEPMNFRRLSPIEWKTLLGFAVALSRSARNRRHVQPFSPGSPRRQ